MRLIDNINSLLGEDFKQTLKPGSKLKIAASCFSIYAYVALKKEQREFHIPKTERERSVTGSVQVMLFADRLEIWNPGHLPAALNLQTLRQPHGSYPANPLIAEPLYLAQYIERMGTGIGDMIERCAAHGLQEPEFKQTDGFVTTIWRKPELALSHVGGETREVAEQVTEQVAQLLKLAVGEMTRSELMAAVGLRARVNFSRNYLDPALEKGLIEMTLPHSPKSPTQKYRLTPSGQQLANQGKK